MKPAAKPFEGQSAVRSEAHSRHVEAVTQMYHVRVDGHNYFLHEYFQGTESLKEPLIQGTLLHSQRRDVVHWICNESRAIDCEGAPRAKRHWVTDKLSMHRRRTGHISVRKPDTAKTSLSERIGAGNPERCQNTTKSRWQDGGVIRRTTFHWT